MSATRESKTPRFTRASWSAEHDAILRDGYGRVPTRVIAKAVGRTPGAVKQHARNLGLDSGRRVTRAEVNAIRELYPTHTARQIAVRLYGDPARVQRVFKIVEHVGLTKLRFWPAEVLERVKALHAEGLTDRLIAERMAGTFDPGDNGRAQVRFIRDRFKLPANRTSAQARQIHRDRVRNQLRSLGLTNPNDLRKQAHRRFARQYGLPDDLKPPQVRMVLAMLVGPMTTPALIAAIGAAPKARLLHNGTGTTYQADLCNRGLVARIPTGIGGSAKGPRVLYTLTAAALDMLAAAPEEGPES